MTDQDKRSLTRTRVFLLLFFGLAAILCVTTILGTWDEQKNGIVDPATVNSPLAQPPAN